MTKTILKSTIRQMVKEEIASSKRRRLRESKFEEPTEENLKKYGLDPKKAKINKDGSIDYDGDVLLGKKKLKQIPFQFNKVSGIFSVSDNQLTSLQGSPKEVGNSFVCFNNKTDFTIEDVKKVSNVRRFIITRME